MIKDKKSNQLKPTPKKEFNIIITPEKAIEFSEWMDRNIPPYYSRQIAALINSFPTQEIDGK